MNIDLIFANLYVTLKAEKTLFDFKSHNLQKEKSICSFSLSQQPDSR